MENYESALLPNVEDVEIFIRAFIDAEYRCEQAKYDVHVSDEAFQPYQERASGFMRDNASDDFTRGGGLLERILNNPTKRAGVLGHLKRPVPRTLFQIRHYQHPTLGDPLKRIVTGDDLFACYVSYPSTGSRELYFSSIFYVAETSEGLKIIYRKSFNSDKGFWYHPAPRAIAKVMKQGRHLETKKYVAPVEATSLADYNKPK